MTNMVGAGAVHVGADVEVCFARSGEAFIPLFRLAGR
jgi:hypothetical protein